MSLIANIAIVATDFVRHPFSETGKTGPPTRMRKVILDKKFASPTMSQAPYIHREHGGYAPHGAGDDIAQEIMGQKQIDISPGPPPKPAMPLHKIALWFFIVLTFGCLAADVALAFVTDEPYTGVQIKAFKLLDWGFTTGVGTIAGVLTGKASGLP